MYTVSLEIFLESKETVQDYWRSPKDSGVNFQRSPRTRDWTTWIWIEIITEMDEDTPMTLASMGLQRYLKKLLLATFGGHWGSNSLFWKLANKGKELSIYPPFPGHTSLQSEQTIDVGWFLCREIFQLRKRRGTESTYQHFATPNELMDTGNDYQWVQNSADEELMGDNGQIRLTAPNPTDQSQWHRKGDSQASRTSWQKGTPPPMTWSCQKHWTNIWSSLWGYHQFTGNPGDGGVLNDTSGICSARSNGEKLYGMKAFFSKNKRIKERKRRRVRGGRGRNREGTKKKGGDTK